MTFDLRQGDCLEVMKELPDASVDAVITDPPYGTTACKWDSVIPFEPMWKELKRIAKPKAAICLFGSQPFTSALVMSNPKQFKYSWYWYKNSPSGFQLASVQPMRAIEEVTVFYSEQPMFNKQPTASRMKARRVVGQRMTKNFTSKRNDFNLGVKPQHYFFPESISPRNVLEFDSVPNASGRLHPTQKPVDLLRYLIRTYTNEGETVLDFTMGSGSTGVACGLENRSFIGIELDPTYFKVAQKRIQEVEEKEPLWTMPVMTEGHMVASSI